MSGYFPSPWPAEDGGAARLATATRDSGIGLTSGERLRATVRHCPMTTMTVLGAPGEVFLLRHSALRARLGVATSALVERIDPISLQPVARSPRLPGGPMWPGGMAVHANGDLIVVYGRWIHRLARDDCRIIAAYRLPIAAPYNSFVVLENGLLVMKNLSASVPAQLVVLDPETLQPVAAPMTCPEPSIARLSALGNSVYVVGVRSILRYHWDGGALVPDPSWRHDYVGASGQSHGWDVVLDGRDAWFMDNGAHRYAISMINRGVSPTANRLIRVSLSDGSDVAAVPVSGLPAGTITNPPLVDRQRSIVVGFDSGNRHLAAWRIGAADRAVTPLWSKSGIGCASHMILEPERGHLITNDYRKPGMGHGGESVVILDISTGAELARAHVGGLMQGVVFPSPGWARDIYWCSMQKLARIWVD